MEEERCCTVCVRRITMKEVRMQWRTEGQRGRFAPGGTLKGAAKKEKRKKKKRKKGKQKKKKKERKKYGRSM